MSQRRGTRGTGRARPFLLRTCCALLLLWAFSQPSLAQDAGSEEPEYGPFDWFRNIQDSGADGQDGLPKIANVLTLMAALQAADSLAGHDVLKLFTQEGQSATRSLADKLASTLGSEYASYQPAGPDSPQRGSVHIDLGALLDLDTHALDTRLGAAAHTLGTLYTDIANIAQSFPTGPTATTTTDSTTTTDTTNPGPATATSATTANRASSDATYVSDTRTVSDKGGYGFGDEMGGAEYGSSSTGDNTHGEGDSSSAEPLNTEEGLSIMNDLLAMFNITDTTAEEVLSTMGQFKGFAGAQSESEMSEESVSEGQESVSEGDSVLVSRKRGLKQVTGPERIIGNYTNQVTGTLLPGVFPGLTGAGKAAPATASVSVTKPGLLGSSITAALGLNWEALQSRVQDTARRVLDRTILNKGPVRAVDRLTQVFQVVVDRLTNGQGLGNGCTPYVFNGGGRPLPETIIFPSFSLSQTTGNCVLIPEFIGNGEYPGQWSLLNSRIACLGPATEYLQVPGFWRGAATSAETFACPTCRNEFSLGPELAITLVGNANQRTVTFKNRAEFLAALQTNKTFGFKGGLDVAVQAFRDKLQAHSEILSRHLGLTVPGASSQQQSAGGATAGGGDVLGNLGSWVASAWSKWQEGARASVLDSPALRELLMDQEEGTAGMDTADMQSAAQAARAAEQAAAPPDTQEPPGQGSAAAGQDAGGDWQGMLARLLEQARMSPE